MSLELNVRKVLQLLSPNFSDIRHVKSEGTRQQPLILGLTGLQGSGKSTWASIVVKLLRTEFGLEAIQVSLDDFYRTHDGLVKVREDHPDNKLLRTRGQPGTHDEDLAMSFFQSLQGREPDLRIPVFEKSLHDGEGDRLPTTEWPRVPADVDVVVFEGWCVGFQPLLRSEIINKQHSALEARDCSEPHAASINTLGEHSLEHLLTVNKNLERYCNLFMGPQHFDILIHLDTDDLNNVYAWRIEQEHALMKARGTGMSDDSVTSFVKGYMPAYELYLEQLRKGFFLPDTSNAKHKLHIRLLLGRNREVQKVLQV